MTPIISVLMPVFNVEKYLEKTLNSLLAQSFTAWELIAVDDGSTDNSGKILDKYKEKDNRFRVIHKENEGVSVARNTALDNASCDLIFFLDSDDIIIPECLELFYNSLTENNADMVQGNFRPVNDDMTDYNFKHSSIIKNEIIDGVELIKRLATDTGFYYVMSCNKLMKKSLYDGFRYPVGKIHEDHFAIHHIAYPCEKIVCIEKETYLYVKHGGSITMKSFSSKNITKEEAIYDRCRFLEEKGLHTLACDTAYFTLREIPRIIQRCYLGGYFDGEVRQQLLAMADYEYKLCKDTNFHINRIIFRLLCEIITKKPDLYISYLSVKYKFLPPPK